MDVDTALGAINQMLWTTMLVSAPILVATLITGLVVSILQATTQLQEMTLSYVPKLLIAAAILIGFGPWMIDQMTQLAIRLISLIPQIH